MIRITSMVRHTVGDETATELENTCRREMCKQGGSSMVITFLLDDGTRKFIKVQDMFSSDGAFVIPENAASFSVLI